MRVQKLGKDYRTVWHEGAHINHEVLMIDQTQLPFQFDTFGSPNVESTCHAIKDMLVRGAGAIGAAAAFGMAQGFSEAKPEEARQDLESTRPTAINLSYATNRVYQAAVASEFSAQTAWEEAQAIADEDAAACLSIGRHGADLIPDGGQILTHCNAGWLAFVDWGSALSPVYVAHREGKKVKVYADETSPRHQGSRLTAWELYNEGVEHEILPDTNAADLMQNDKIDAVIVGADRIAANGDTANKIGTLLVAIAADYFKIPFYVAAPTSTIDLNTSNGTDIPIETRSQEEVQYKTGQTREGRIAEVLVTNPGSPARNRAFDVTPAELIKGIITPAGIIKPTIQEILRIKQAA